MKGYSRYFWFIHFLGDIILISDPTNEILNDNIFFIEYIDSKKNLIYVALYPTELTSTYFQNLHDYDSHHKAVYNQLMKTAHEALSSCQKLKPYQVPT